MPRGVWEVSIVLLLSHPLEGLGEGYLSTCRGPGVEGWNGEMLCLGCLQIDTPQNTTREQEGEGGDDKGSTNMCRGLQGVGSWLGGVDLQLDCRRSRIGP